MELNIETKDVQRTEYLDKNGLDMLWAKVKENTNNQVEVERNRAVAKENSIIDTKADKSVLDNYVLTTALAEYAKKTEVPKKTSELTNDSGFITSAEVPEVDLTAYAKKTELPTKVTLLANDAGYITLDLVPETDLTDYAKKTEIPKKTSLLTNDSGYITLEQVPEVDLSNYATKDLIPTKNSLLTNDSGYITLAEVPETDLSEYAKKTDIPEINTSDFVSKTTTDNLSIKSRLNVSDVLRVGNNNNSSNISLNASDGAPILSVYAMGGNQYNASLTSRELRMSSTLNNLVITCNGISSKDNNANHAFSTDGGVIDTTAFALKSELDSYAKKTDIPEVDTSDFVIKTARNIQTIKAPLTVTGALQVNDTDNRAYAYLSVTQGLGLLAIFNKNTSGRSYLEGDSLLINEGSGDSIRITCQGIRNIDNNANHVYATDGSIADLTQYAKKADITKVDTSGFVSKTTTDNQSIKSGLNVSNNLNVVDGNNEPLIDLGIYNTPYDTNTNSSISVKSFFDGIVDGEQKYQKGGCMIEMVAGDQRNPYIIISTGTEDSYTGENEIKITKSGIIQKSHMYEEDAEYYFAANGTINNIYNTNDKDIYRYFNDISTSVNNEGVFVSSWNNLTEETEGVRIKNSGISITNGSLNEVFATDGSIADLTQYVLKSIYDEKIAALESRIAALEANHTA